MTPLKETLIMVYNPERLSRICPKEDFSPVEE